MHHVASQAHVDAEEIACGVAQHAVLATRLGGKAVELLKRSVFGKMVANHPPDIVPVPLADVVGRTRKVPLDYDLIATARAIGISFGE